MIDAYKYFNGKIFAYDEFVKKEYDYQDNIHEILEQENVIEELGNTIKKLYKDRNHLKDSKTNLKRILSIKKYRTLILLALSLTTIVTIIVVGCMLKMGVSSLVLESLWGTSLIPLISTLIYSYEKYEKDNQMRLLSIEQQIEEFEEKFQVELEKLNKLHGDKSKKNYDKNVTNVIVGINNKNIKEFSNITRKKQLYKFYRDYLGKFKRYNNKEYLKYLYGIEFTFEDVEFINELDKKNKAKVLSKGTK